MFSRGVAVFAGVKRNWEGNGSSLFIRAGGSRGGKGERETGGTGEGEKGG